MVDLVFLEYSFNPDQLPSVDVYKNLNELGFSCKREHNQSGVQIWGQDECLLLIRQNSELTQACGITGMGFLTDLDIAHQFPNVVYDTETDYYLIPDPEHKLNIYLIDHNSVKRSYQTPINSVSVEPLFSKFWGAEWCSVNDNIMAVLTQLASHTGTDPGYQKFTFSNKFMLFLNEKDSATIKLVADTRDVFETTAKLSFKNAQLMNFTQCVQSDDQVGSLTHKVVGYNCKAFGNTRSYSIENYAESAQLNLDIIFRERKNYLKISTESLVFYNEHKK
jgi:hypothetical protein